MRGIGLTARQRSPFAACAMHAKNVADVPSWGEICMTIWLGVAVY